MKERPCKDLLDNVRSYVTHDVRNPLSAVWTSVALLTELDDGSDPLTSRSLATITSGLNRTLRKLDLVGVALEIEAGQRVAQVGDVLVADLLRGVRDRSSGIDVDHSIQFEARVQQVRVDRGLLEGALVALLDNAVLHGGGPDGVRCIVEEGEREGTIAFSVEDTGPSPQNADGLFMPLGEPDRRAKGAVGVGLALVRAVAELHGGTWRFERRDSGGSRFTVEVPGGTS